MAGFKLKTELLDLSGPASGALLCIDFGTAMCKAVASMDVSQRLLLLELGSAAGDPGNRYPVASSLFISDRGLLYFGHEAIDQSLRQREFAVRRIDSIKRWLSTGPLSDLDVVAVEPLYNPSTYSFSQGDALTMLFAYVTDLAGFQLKKHRVSRLIKRRFTRPVWESKRGRWYDDLMFKYLTRAQLVADTLTGVWSGGIPMSVIREVLDDARKIELPNWLVHPRGALEPVAAGVSRLEREHEHRSLAVVVDVGAGTTDMAAMTVIQLDGAKAVRRAVPQGKPSSIRTAGDVIDAILKNHILSSTRVPAVDAASIDVQVEQSMRRWKEQLFRQGTLLPTFSGGLVGKEVRLDSFLSLGQIKSFEHEIEAQFEEELSSIKSAAQLFSSSLYHPLNEISLIPAGGGARLRAVSRLVSRRQKLGGLNLPVVSMGYEPEWFRKGYRDTAEIFPQMAVAIGGSSPMYPELPAEEKGRVLRRGAI